MSLMPPRHKAKVRFRPYAIRVYEPMQLPPKSMHVQVQVHPPSMGPSQRSPSTQISRTPCTMIRSFKGIKQETPISIESYTPIKINPSARPPNCSKKRHLSALSNTHLLKQQDLMLMLPPVMPHLLAYTAENPQEISESQIPPLYLSTAGLHCRSGITVQTPIHLLP